MMAEYELDVKRLLCPMPVIKTQKMVKTLYPGDTLKVIATDPGALNDIPSWCRISGHSVIRTIESNNEVHIYIKVGRKE